MLTVLADCSRLSDNRVVAGRVRSNFSQICQSRKTNSVGEAGLWVVLARGTEDGRPSLERSRQRVQNLSENFDFSFPHQQHSTAQHSNHGIGMRDRDSCTCDARGLMSRVSLSPRAMRLFASAPTNTTALSLSNPLVSHIHTLTPRLK